MSKPKPTTKPPAAQALIPSILSDRPFSPKQARFYFQALEMVVGLYFGAKGREHLESFSRFKARKLKGVSHMRVGTLMAVITKLLEERGRLYPHSDNRNKPVA